MNKISKVETPDAVTREHDSIYPAKILAALSSVMSSVGYVQKKGKNDFQKYNYAGEGHLLEVLRPAMIEAGLLLIPSHRDFTPPDANGITHVAVEYTLAHKDGDVWPEKIVVYGAGSDKNSKGVGDKGLYKALTGANKYLLFKLFQIETGDDPEKPSAHDKDDGEIVVINDAEAMELARLIDETATDVSKFLKFMKVTELNSIPAAEFGKAKHALEQKRKQIDKAA